MPGFRPRRLAVFALPLAAAGVLAGCGAPPAGPSTPPPATATTAPAPASPTRPAGPTAAASPSASPAASDNIRVTKPTAKQETKTPLAVQGQARVFEATLQVVLKDAKGAKLAEKTVTASMGAPEWGDYATTLPFTVAARTEATLEAFALSPKDGTPQYTVSVPVVLLPN